MTIRLSQPWEVMPVQAGKYEWSSGEEDSEEIKVPWCGASTAGQGCFQPGEKGFVTP